MSTFVMLFSMNDLGGLLSKFHHALNTKVVWNVVEIMLTKIHHFCISIPRIMTKLVHFGLQ
jgi:hypothetical protein